MHESLEKICVGLDTLSSTVINAWADNRTLCEAYGWHHPALTKHDLANLSKRIADRIREVAPDEIDDSLNSLLEAVPKKLQLIQGNTVTYMFNGNGNQAAPAFIATMDWLAQTLEPILGWQVLQDNKAMPAQLARRLRSIQADLSELVPEKDELQKQIQLIQDATEAAESLPVDLQNLREARNKVSSLSIDSAELYGKIDQHFKQATDAVEKILKKDNEADKLVQQCEEAYRITTTKGLAAAFDQRASRLGSSMWVWVLGLLIALGIGAYLGGSRISVLSSALNSSNPQLGVIWINIILSILSIGAPLWFAWLATKQIGHRFRLSEDYAYKASVAKAYEGYRREAARIDEAFEARLFSSALSRLEEAPLRLIEQDTHGSPWQELISSEQFQNALRTVPELRDKFFDLAKEGISRKNWGIKSKGKEHLLEGEE